MPAITGATTGTQAEVETTGRNVHINTPGISAVGVARGGGAANAGAVQIVSDVDDGSVTLVRRVRTPKISLARRLTTGVDTVLFSDSINASGVNSNIYNSNNTTMTIGFTGAGMATFSAVQGTTSSHGAYLKTWQYFPLSGTAPLIAEFVVGQSVTPVVANEVFQCGFGNPTAVATAHTDGAYFQLDDAGLKGFVAYNGVLTSTGVIASLASMTVGSMFRLTITVDEAETLFQRDGVTLGRVITPVGQGQPFLQGSLPVYAHKFNTAAVSNTNTIKLSDIAVLTGDVQTGKPWGHQMAGAGLGGYCTQNGATTASTAGNFSQSAIVAAGAGTNTALPVGHAAGLGGYMQMTAQATNVAAAGDMIATSYQNPASTVNATGRNLYVTGVRISAANVGAVIATTSTVLVWGVAFGHTSVSLATTEATNTHAPRRVPIGIMTAAVGAVVGQSYDRDLVMDFSSAPIVVRPGEFIASTVRFLNGTATASQAVAATVAFSSYFE